MRCDGLAAAQYQLQQCWKSGKRSLVGIEPTPKKRKLPIELQGERRREAASIFEYTVFSKM